MKIVFVEDTPAHINRCIPMLKESGYFELSCVKSYLELTSGEIRATELFVLDVQIDGQDDDFLGSVRHLKNLKKAFIVFTAYTDNHPMETTPGKIGIRQLAIEHGCYAFLSKSSVHQAAANRSIQYDLAELVLQFYWSRVRSD